MTWQKTAETENQKWYFVGSSNKDGGYIIVDASSNTPANSGAKYRVVENGNLTISFIGADNQRLSIGGVNEFLIRSMRSKLALDLQIYSMPCGSVADFMSQTQPSYPKASHSTIPCRYATVRPSAIRRHQDRLTNTPL